MIPRPDLVVVADDVDPARLEAGATLFPGARVGGARTVVRSGARIGSGGPVTLVNCAVGRDVDLASGSFEDAVFLDGASFGPSGHARAGTLFEEGASAAHATGVKQTILLPYATLGSNVNCCDCLLAGGTSPKDHSEIGSGFIHFNFTPFGPTGDKATASLFGDVSRGVWLRSKRIFLGGAGGVVGPVTIGFGTVLGAGSVYRRDRGEGKLVYGETLPPREVDFDPTVQRRAVDRMQRSLVYLGNLAALRTFHLGPRRRLAGDDPFGRAMVDAAVALLDAAAVERVRQVERLVAGLAASAAALTRFLGDDHPEVRGQRALVATVPSRAAELAELASVAVPPPPALELAFGAPTPDVPARIRALPEPAVQAGIAWLDGIVRAYTGGWLRVLLPGLDSSPASG